MPGFFGSISQLFNVGVRFTADTSQFVNGIGAAEAKTQGFNNQLQSLIKGGLQVLTVYIGAKTLDAFVKWGAEMTSLQGKLNLLNRRAVEFNTTGGKLIDTIQQATNYTVSMRDSVFLANRSLEILGGDQGTMIKVAQAASGLAKIAGTDVTSAMQMLFDAVSTGRVKSLKPLITDLDEVKWMTKEMGLASTGAGDAIERQKVRMELLNEILEKTQKIAGTPDNPFVQLKVAAQDLADALGLAIFDKTGKFHTGMEAIAAKVRELKDWVKENKAEILAWAEQLLTAVKVIGTVALVGSFINALNGIIVLFSGPFGIPLLIAAAIIPLIGFNEQIADFLLKFPFIKAAVEWAKAHSGARGGDFINPETGVTTRVGDEGGIAQFGQAGANAYWESISQKVLPMGPPAPVPDEIIPDEIIPVPALNGPSSALASKAKSRTEGLTQRLLDYIYGTADQMLLRSSADVIKSFLNRAVYGFDPFNDLMQTYPQRFTSEQTGETYQRSRIGWAPKPIQWPAKPKDHVGGWLGRPGEYGVKPEAKADYFEPSPFAEVFTNLRESLVSAAGALGEDILSGNVGGAIKNLFSSLGKTIGDQVQKMIAPKGSSMGLQMLGSFAGGLVGAGIGLLGSLFDRGKTPGYTAANPSYTFVTNLKDFFQFGATLPTSFVMSGRGGRFNTDPHGRVLDRALSDYQLGDHWDV